jgi:hypothetical protein
LVEEVGFVDFCLGQEEQSNDLVVSHEAGCDEWSLLVILGLEIDIDQFVL